MNKYQEALNKITPTTNDYELIEATKTIQQLIDKETTKSNEISMSLETLIDLCRGDIGVMDLTGQTLYELTGDMKDYDESLDGDDDEES